MSRSNAQSATPKSRIPNAKPQAQNLQSKTILPVFKTQSPKPKVYKSKVVQSAESQTQNPEAKYQFTNPKCTVQNPKSKAQMPKSKACSL